MHDLSPRPEQITTGILSLEADAIFARAQALEHTSGQPGLVQATPTDTGVIERLHVVVPVGENQIDMTSMSRDSRTASRSRTVRRLDPVVLERTTGGTDVSYRIIADPAYQEPGKYEHEHARWGHADPQPQKRESGINRAGRTENVRPLRPEEAQDVLSMVTGGHPYNPAEQTLLQSRKGDKLIKKNVLAGLRTLLGHAGMVTSKWSEN